MRQRRGTRAALWIGALVLSVAASGCAVNRESATIDPSADLKSIRTIHVVRLAEDDRGVNVDIAETLKRRGYVVTTDLAPRKDVDAVVTYWDKWMWDITMYMIQLTVTVRDPANDYPLATGNSIHTSLTRKSQKEMVDEVIANILKKGNPS